MRNPRRLIEVLVLSWSSAALLFHGVSIASAESAAVLYVGYISDAYPRNIDIQVSVPGGSRVTTLGDTVLAEQTVSIETWCKSHPGSEGLIKIETDAETVSMSCSGTARKVFHASSPRTIRIPSSILDFLNKRTRPITRPTITSGLSTLPGCLAVHLPDLTRVASYDAFLFLQRVQPQVQSGEIRFDIAAEFLRESLGRKYRAGRSSTAPLDRLRRVAQEQAIRWQLVEGDAVKENRAREGGREYSETKTEKEQEATVFFQLINSSMRLEREILSNRLKLLASMPAGLVKTSLIEAYKFNPTAASRVTISASTPLSTAIRSAPERLTKEFKLDPGETDIDLISAGLARSIASNADRFRAVTQTVIAGRNRILVIPDDGVTGPAVAEIRSADDRVIANTTSLGYPVFDRLDLTPGNYLVNVTRANMKTSWRIRVVTKLAVPNLPGLNVLDRHEPLSNAIWAAWLAATKDRFLLEGVSTLYAERNRTFYANMMFNRLAFSICGGTQEDR